MIGDCKILQGSEIEREAGISGAQPMELELYIGVAYFAYMLNFAS